MSPEVEDTCLDILPCWTSTCRCSVFTLLLESEEAEDLLRGLIGQFRPSQDSALTPEGFLFGAIWKGSRGCPLSYPSSLPQSPAATHHSSGMSPSWQKVPMPRNQRKHPVLGLVLTSPTLPLSFPTQEVCPASHEPTYSVLKANSQE